MPPSWMTTGQNNPNLTQTEGAKCSWCIFLFTGDDVFKQVSMLSGGERVRLALCKILKEKTKSFLDPRRADKPYGYCRRRSTLEQMLKGYQGNTCIRIP